MQAKLEVIEQKRQAQIARIHKEVSQFGSFESQYKKLRAFRDELRKFYQWSFFDKLFIPKLTQITTGDLLDHHILAYFAPFEFKRVSWGRGIRYPYEHIKLLSEKLHSQGSRFIYVSLPLKGMIYPEYAVDEKFFTKSAPTAPQFRKMTLKLLEEKVEVLDMFPIFMENKDKNLFCYTHNISTSGCELTAQIIADYIKETTVLKTENQVKFTKTTQQTDNDKRTRQCLTSKIYKDKKPYIVPNRAGIKAMQQVVKDYQLPPYEITLIDNNIAIFGNCNLQGFHDEATGIASNLAYNLNTEIDYLGRKLIFENDFDKFDTETYQECCRREIVICIGFLTGSFVRSSMISSKKECYKRIKQIAFRHFKIDKINKILCNHFSDISLD